MLINISSGFFHSRQNSRIFFRLFQFRTWKITVSALRSVNFYESFLKCGKDICSLKISDEFDYIGSALIKYAHNGPFNEPGYFGIPGIDCFTPGSGRVVLIDNGRVYKSKAADALVKTTKFGTNVGLNMLLNISFWYFWGLFMSRQLRGLPSSDGYFCKQTYACIVGGNSPSRSLVI